MKKQSPSPIRGKQSLKESRETKKAVNDWHQKQKPSANGSIPKNDQQQRKKIKG